MTVLTTGPVTKAPAWVQSLSKVAWVNSVAISEKGDRVIGATYIHDFEANSKIYGQFATFCFDVASTGGKPVATNKWTNRMTGWDGIFAVGISGDGTVAATGGYFTPPFAGPNQTTGLVMIFDAATGTVLFNSSATKTPIGDTVNVVSLSRDGAIVAAAADQLYVYARSVRNNRVTYTPIQSAAPSTDPDFRTTFGPVTSVAVHPSGTWLAACNERGQLLVATIANGVITRMFIKEVSKEPVNATDRTSSVLAPVRFLSVAVSGNDDAEAFVAGGSDVVYRSTVSDMATAANPPVRYDAGGPAAPVVDPAPPEGVTDAKARQNVRWIAISGDGATFAAVANRKTPPPSPSANVTSGNALNGSPQTVNYEGELLIFDAQSPKPKTTVPLEHNPNSVSMDADGEIITVAEGNPPGTPGLFRRFDFSGTQVWQFETGNMNWPIAVSADGSAIAAGGDDGHLYYFLP
ncbi:MAG TPA: hypothetical protein VL693_02195 [Vicinamibacterales bacterium]|jgi:WD40 repeat protein|nr:hypothetical protein [Vicinamibacterales bacterium]